MRRFVNPKADFASDRAVTCDHESQRSLAAVGLQKELQTVLEHTLGKGGENGTNFCWRDKDHRCQSRLLEPMSGLISYQALFLCSDSGSTLGTTD